MCLDVDRCRVIVNYFIFFFILFVIRGVLIVFGFLVDVVLDNGSLNYGGVIDEEIRGYFFDRSEVDVDFVESGVDDMVVKGDEDE